VPLAVFLLVVCVTAALRLPAISAVPNGLHGDEASAVLEAQRIWRERWIGVYSPIAGGNPAGFYYLVALTIGAIRDPITAVRTTSALIAVATVAALFILVRSEYGLLAAAVSCLWLAINTWHRIFSRLGHVTNLWPFAAVLMAISLAQATRKRRPGWWGVAGAMTGAGLYSYNGHFVLIPLVTAFALIAVYTQEASWRSRIIQSAAFVAALAIVATPLLLYISEHPQDVLGRARELSVLNAPEWAQQSSLSAGALFIVRRYVSAWDQLSFHSVPTPVDLTGVVPLVPPASLALSAFGLVVALVRRRSPLTSLAALIVCVLPLSPALFTDFAMRRALAMAPFLALFAGIGVAELVGFAISSTAIVRTAVATAVVACLVVAARQDLAGFNRTIDAANTRWAMSPELVETTRFLSGLASDRYVYFYATRWPLNHEIIKLLAPRVVGETRGAPYANESTALTPSTGRPVFVLLGNYREWVDRIARQYPGGDIVTGNVVAGSIPGPSFIAYVVR